MYTYVFDVTVYDIMKSKNVGVGFAAVPLGRGVVRRTKRIVLRFTFCIPLRKADWNMHDLCSFLPYGWRGGIFMKKNSHNSKINHGQMTGHLRRLAVAALLAAVSLLCGKFLAIPVGTVMRFSFENLPILLAGMMLGPVLGVLTGVVADLVGCLMVGYAINPLVTLGAACIGLVGGVLFRLLSKLPLLWRVSGTVLAAHLVGSVLIKTFGLAVFYDMPFIILLLWRLLNYMIVGVAEGALLYYLLKNDAVRRRLENLR